MRVGTTTLSPTQRIEQLFETVADKRELYVPVQDDFLYAILLQEAISAVVQHDDCDLLIIMDEATACELTDNEVINRTTHAIVLLENGAPLPQDWPNAAERLSCEPPLHENDRLLLLLSDTIHLALFCQRPAHSEEIEGRNFQGGWTVRCATVTRLAQSILGPEKAVLLPESPPFAKIEDRISSTMMRLTALYAGVLESREQNAAVEKNDLLSILDILKVISTKRYALDILQVLVEQIARIIPTDRFSIVRIWEGADEGHVLVSHDEKTLQDCVIQLGKYPELVEALNTGETLVINDTRSHPLTVEIGNILHKAGINSLLLLPILRKDKHLGTLLFRAARRHGPFTLRETRFFQVVTEAAANALERAHLFESIQLANEQLEKLAITDGLTGIYNHRYFHERFEHEFEYAKRYRLPFSCVLFDIDDFKRINDDYGHLVGDVVLKEVAECMVACTRRVDVLARYGGEEFVILLPQTDLNGAAVKGEQMRAVMENHAFSQIPAGQKITISVGVATLDLDSMKENTDLLRAADAALYDAKKAGKNCVVSYQKPQQGINT